MLRRSCYWNIEKLLFDSRPERRTSFFFKASRQNMRTTQPLGDYVSTGIAAGLDDEHSSTYSFVVCRETNLLYLFWSYFVAVLQPNSAQALSLLRYLDNTQLDTPHTPGGTPLNVVQLMAEAATYATHNEYVGRTSMHLAKFERQSKKSRGFRPRPQAARPQDQQLIIYCIALCIYKICIFFFK